MPEESLKNPLYSPQESKSQTKCSALIPDDLLERLRESGYENRAEAIRLGLECLLRESFGESHKNPIYSLNESQVNPNESLRIIEELEKHNETLKKELDKAAQDKEDLKATYNNYFLQVQTLINQKAIDVGGKKEKWWKFW